MTFFDESLAYAECVIDGEVTAHRPARYRRLTGYRKEYTTLGSGGMTEVPVYDALAPCAKCRPAPGELEPPPVWAASLGYAVKVLAAGVCPTCYPDA